LSTAFLVRSGESALLYLGDTGSDIVEHAGRLRHLWEAVAPLVKTGHLKAIFIEVSFPDEQPLKSLFGHLTPRLLTGEMKTLEGLAGPGLLRGLPVVITHRKPSGDQEPRIRRQVEAENALGLKLVFPTQGRKYYF
jgi:3',5'-cyclic-nucleotide phosphodiesterase